MWKCVKDYEHIYSVSIYGDIKNIKTNRILKYCKNGAGYCHVILCNGISKKQVSVHRLVAQLFIPNKDNKPCINHKNGNKSDNSVENLEWCTYQENTIHAYKNRLIIPYDRKGDKAPNKKITRDIINNVKECRENGSIFSELVSMFNLSRASISNIINNKTYLGDIK